MPRRIVWTDEVCKELLSLLEKYPHNLTEGMEKFAQLKGVTPNSVRGAYYNTHTTLYRYRKQHQKLATISGKAVLLAGKNGKRGTRVITTNREVRSTMSRLFYWLRISRWRREL